jgi:PGF-CTERM protein
MNEHISRRGFLAATVGAVGAGQFVSAASATQQEVDIYFDGATRAWTGREPSSIDGEDNPTLTLYEGETYVLAWQNVDAAPHNVVFENDAGDNLVETEIVAEEGAIQRVEFEATAEMVRYYCQVHPGSMEGEVAVVSPDSGDGIPSDTNVVVTDQPTETPEPTTTTTTPTTTTTAAPTTTESDEGASGGDSSPTTAPAETTSESGPGLGVLAALAGVGSVGALLSRRSDE